MTLDLRRKVTTAIASTTSRICEARCGVFLEKHLPYFVCADEGGVVDYGLVVSDHNDLGAWRGFARTRQVLTRHEGQEVIVGLDCKTMSSHLLKSKVYRHIAASNAQTKHCVGFLVQDTSLPDWTALVPTYYLSGPDKILSLQCTEAWGGGEWATAAFGPEWALFVMPTAMLPEACRSLYEFVLDPDKKWRNPHNNIVFTDLPDIAPGPVEILNPDERSPQTDGPFIAGLWQAFERYASDHEMTRMRIMPVCGDFMFRRKHGVNEKSARVELKRDCGSLNGHTLTHVTRLRADAPARSRFFKADTEWDLLFTTVRGGEKAFLLWRDELPNHWFMNTTDRDVSWPLPNNIWTGRQFRLTFDKRMVEAIEKILRSRSSMTVTEPPAAGLAQSTGDLEAMTILDDGDEENEEEREVEEKGREQEEEEEKRDGKSRRNWHMRAWEYRQRRMIMDECARLGFGLIFPLGRHPRGSHIFMSYRWTGEQQAAYRGRREIPLPFYRIAAFTPVLPLNLAPVSVIGGYNDAKRVVFEHVTHAPEVSLYILDTATPFPGEGLEEPTPSRLLVPSPTLYSSSLRAQNDKRINCRRGARMVALMKGRPLDAFQVENTELVPKLLRFFEGDGDRLWLGYQEVRIADHLTTYREMLQSWIGNTDLYWRSREQRRALLGLSNNTGNGDDDDDEEED